MKQEIERLKELCDKYEEEHNTTFEIWQKDIQEMMSKLDNEPKVLIIKKEFYEKFKNKIDDLIKDNWFLDLVITNMLDDKTTAIVMDKAKFYGIDI